MKSSLFILSLLLSASLLGQCRWELFAGYSRNDMRIIKPATNGYDYNNVYYSHRIWENSKSNCLFIGGCYNLKRLYVPIAIGIERYTVPVSIEFSAVGFEPKADYYGLTSYENESTDLYTFKATASYYTGTIGVGIRLFKATDQFNIIPIIKLYTGGKINERINESTTRYQHVYSWTTANSSHYDESDTTINVNRHSFVGSYVGLTSGICLTYTISKSLAINLFAGKTCYATIVTYSKNSGEDFDIKQNYSLEVSCSYLFSRKKMKFDSKTD